MPTFEQRTGIGKPPRRRQKPVAVPKGPPPARQRATPKAKRTPPAVIRKRATIPGKGLPSVAVPGTPKHFQRKAAKRVGSQPKLTRLTKLEQARENLSGQGYTPPKYGPAGQTTLGEKIVTALTGVSPTSQKPGSLSNAAITAGLGLASVGGTELVSAGTRAAASALKAGASAADAARAAEEAAGATRVAKAAEAAGKAPAATEAEQKAFYAKKLRTPEQTATRGERAARAVKGTPKRVVRRAKATPKAAAKKAFSAPSPESRTARALSGTSEGARALATPAAIFKGHGVGAIIHSQAEGLTPKHIGKTLATTARVVPQLPAAAITPVAAAIESAKTGSLKPLGGVVKQYEDYGKLYAKLAGPQGAKVTENQLGLLPAITLGLGSYGVTKEVRKLRPKGEKAPPLEPRSIRKAREVMNDTTKPDEVRRAARDKVRQAQTETRRSAHAGRKRSAVNTATMRESAQAKFGAEGGKKVYRGMREAASHKIPGGKLREHDLVRYLGTEGLVPGGRMRKAVILRELERRRAALKPSKKKLSKLDIHDRTVIDAILQHPEVLDSPRIGPLAEQFRAIGHGRSIERHTEETGQRQTTPSPADELVRTQKIARAEGIPLPHETAGYEARVRLHKQARGKLKDAIRVEAGHAEGDAAALRAEAADLKTKANEADQKAADEHMAAVQSVIEQKGYSQPFYAPERDVAKAKGLSVAGEYNVGRKGKKERFRSQTLTSQGRIEQSGAQLMEGLRAQRFWMEQRAMDRRFINEEMVKQGDGKLLIDTEANLNALREQGKIPSSGALVPLSELAPAIQRDPALRALAEEARLKAKLGPKGRSLYFFSRSRAAWDEHRAQNELAGRAVRYARVIGRAQSALLIGTSPIWFTLQLAATPLWLAFSHTNPVEYARTIRKQHDIYRRAPADVKASLHGIFGSNPADVIGSQLTRNALDPQHFNRAHDAFRLTYKTPVGRMIHDIAESLRSGGPLIGANRRYESAWRHLAGLMEMDRVLLKDPKARSRVTNFAEETSRLQDAVFQQTHELRKMSPAERATYFVDHPSMWREVQQRLEDSLGSWTHLTKAERNATSVLVFYPFLRASMRWLFYSAPKNHPWKLAIAANLAQSNAATFQKESKGRPSYFTAWGNLPIYGASGKVSNFVNVQRFAPGANALIQAIGGGQQSLLSIFTSPLQPVIGNTITAAAGQTPFGSASQESFGGQMAQNALGLSPFSRAVEHGGIGPIKAPFPYSVISQAFRKIQGQPSGIMGIINPAVIQSPDQVREAQRLSDNLKIAGYSHADAQADVIAGKLTPKQAGVKRQKAQKAQKAIDKELVKLHLETSKSQKKKSKQIGTKLGKLSQQEYQQPSGGGGPWGGSSGPSPWGSTSGKSPWG